MLLWPGNIEAGSSLVVIPTLRPMPVPSATSISAFGEGAPLDANDFVISADEKTSIQASTVFASNGTPVHASWLNHIEIYFSIVQRKVHTPTTSLPWPNLSSAYLPSRSTMSGRHRPSNGPSRAPIFTPLWPRSPPNDWLRQPDRKYVSVIPNVSTKLEGERQ
jgi:hypothetical protein